MAETVSAEHVQCFVNGAFTSGTRPQVTACLCALRAQVATPFRMGRPSVLTSLLESSRAGASPIDIIRQS